MLDWEDALVDFSADPQVAADEFEALLADEERIRRASRRNLVQMHRHHDWGHRVAEVLTGEGLEFPEPLRAHLARLEARASELEAGA